MHAPIATKEIFPFVEFCLLPRRRRNLSLVWHTASTAQMVTTTTGRAAYCVFGLAIHNQIAAGIRALRADRVRRPGSVRDRRDRALRSIGKSQHFGKGTGLISRISENSRVSE